MKVNITVDLEWLGEDGSIDDIMKDELISGVKNAISKNCLARVEKEASEAVNKAIDLAVQSANTLIEEKVLSFVEAWLSNEVIVTDKYGEEVKRGSIKDLIKQQFDGMMNSTVNSDGKVVPAGSYGATKMTVVRFLTGEAVKEVVGSELLNYKRDIDAKIKTEINNGIKTNVSDLFAQMVVNTAQARHAELMAIPHK